MNNAIKIPKDYLYKLIDYYGPKNVIASHDSTESKYWEDFDLEENIARYVYHEHFGFSVPTKKLIQKLRLFINNDSILEIGSGLGLYAYLLSLENIDIKATDKYVDDVKVFLFYEVESLSAKRALEKYSDRNVLMILWPEISDIAYESLIQFKGNKLIYIGEGKKGRTANKYFFKELKRNWKLLKQVDLDNFPYTLEYCNLYERF